MLTQWYNILWYFKIMDNAQEAIPTFLTEHSSPSLPFVTPLLDGAPPPFLFPRLTLLATLGRKSGSVMPSGR